jgi:O-antigen/teichoic acid export membrane protein
MADTLKAKAKQGLIWSSIDNIAHQVLHFIISIIIARELSPSDYGLIGMLSIFLAIATTFVNSGLSDALIQKKDPDHKDYTTVFVFNFSAAIALYFLLFFSAPWIASFYDEPKLISLTRVLSLNLIISSLGLIQSTVLRKKIDFKTSTNINIITLILSGSVGIYLAYNNFGVWALVFQSILLTAIRVILLWLFVKWKPRMIFDMKNFKELFNYSSKLLVSWLINQVVANIYSTVIGKYYNASSLGFYTQARKIQEIPTNSINSIFQSVTFPVLSELNDNNNTVQLRNAYRRLLKLVVSINYPIMVLLFVISKPLIIFLLTSKWEPCIEFFRLFCIVGLVFPFTSINLNITKVVGKTKLYLNLVLIKRLLFISVLFFTVKYGVSAIIVGQIIVTYLWFLIEMKYSGALIDYNLKDQFKDTLPFFLTSVLIGFFIYMPSLFLTNHLLLLSIQLIIFMTLFFCSNWYLKSDLYLELVKVINNN